MEEKVIKEEDDEVVGDVGEHGQCSADVFDDDHGNFQQLQNEQVFVHGVLFIISDCDAQILCQK